MSDIGWVKLYKQTLDSDFWNSIEPFTARSAFIHVLLSANWKDGKIYHDGKTVTIKRGQWLTSIRKLSETFHWGIRRVYRWLDMMEKFGMITRENLKFATLLTVVNYSKYQDYGNATDNANDNTSDNTNDNTNDNATDNANDNRSKKEEERRQKENSQSPAAAGTPPAKKEPPIGSREWLALHYDD
jgi:hypothetical protein